MAQKFEIVFDASMNVGQIKNAVGEIQKHLSSISLPQNLTTKFGSIISNLSKELDNFERISSKGSLSKSEFSEFEKSGKKIIDLYDNLKYSVSNLSNISSKELEKMFPKSITENIIAAKRAIEDYGKTYKAQLADIEKKQKAVDTKTSSLGDLRKKRDKVSGMAETDKAGYTQLSQSVRTAESEMIRLRNEQAETIKKAEELEAKLTAPKKSSTYRETIKQIEDLGIQVKDAENKFNELNDQLENTTTASQKKSELTDLDAKIEDLTKDLEEAQRVLAQTQNNTSAVDNLFNALSKIEGLDISQFPRTIEGANQALQHLKDNGMAQASEGLRTFISTVGQAEPPVRSLGENIDNSRDKFEAFDRRAAEVDSIKNRIAAFFGLSNAINLARRAVQNAFNTIKQLDKTMTETAVVTDFSVGDMWSQLPEYTKRANELGVATNEAYAAATLYYQQGLKTNEVTAVSTETLKMARIAGIEAAQATDYMTAALRGFNMEVNEMSAQRVNDVYSKLAAITASDTQEISVAMTKVASLAHNANMEFETTAAFLSQIIN